MTKFQAKDGFTKSSCGALMAPDKTKHEREAPRTYFQSTKTNRERFREIQIYPILDILEFDKFNFGGSDEEKANFSEGPATMPALHEYE